jgi:pimeloyl-ACP methyl ester carboxylesterase
MHDGSAPTTHNTAETRLVEAPGVAFAHRRVGRLLAGLIPDAQIRIYQDATHGFLFQCPAEVAADVNAFLAGEGSATS